MATVKDQERSNEEDSTTGKEVHALGCGRKASSEEGQATFVVAKQAATQGN